jgi:hypothetical protein
MSFPEFAREQVESDPARWFEPYEKARAEGEWRAPAALTDRIYGRPTQAVTMNTGIDPGELDDDQVATLERLILERIQVERGS